MVIEEKRQQRSGESVSEFNNTFVSYLDQGGLLLPFHKDFSNAYLNDEHSILYRLSVLLNELHAADVADILESLPPEQRLFVWSLVPTEHEGDILLELSDSVRENLIGSLDKHDLRVITSQLDTDEIAYLAHDLPQDVISDVLNTLNVQEQEQLRSALSYTEHQVGYLMDFDGIQIRPDVSCEVVLRYLRRFDHLPSQTDQLFVVDEKHTLLGVLPLHKLLTASPESLVDTQMLRDDSSIFYPDMAAEEAAKAFERYDLVTAPVIDEAGRFIGRLTIDTMLDVLLDHSEAEALNLVGLKEEEDLFAPIVKSVKNRWAWLAINLITALIASKVISLFSGTIEQLVALAALMPIVAGLGGNTGNQTTTMIVRALAMGQAHIGSGMRLWRKELGVGMINGLIWGGVLGMIAWTMYGNPKLGVVMAAATILNLMLAATIGVWVPMLMSKLGRDPAVGSSVMITACTDSGGFFIFLGLASLFLI
jgi:magnesium transporter